MTTHLGYQRARNTRLDAWASISDSPTELPSRFALSAYACRGMQDLDQARAYADDLAVKFSEHGCPVPVFVVRGPTSTSKSAFEVTTACAGYTVEHLARPVIQPATQPGQVGLDTVKQRFDFYCERLEDVLEHFGHDKAHIEMDVRRLRDRLQNGFFRITGNQPINLLHGGRRITRHAIKCAIERAPAHLARIERLRGEYGRQCAAERALHPARSFFSFEAAHAKDIAVDLKPHRRFFYLSPAAADSHVEAETHDETTRPRQRG